MTDNPKVMVLADLHLDEWLAAGRDPLASLYAGMLGSLDALIVAGDLANKPKVRWSKMLAHLGQCVPLSRIHVLPGNHDYYDHVLDGDERLARICTEAGAHFAQKRVIAFGATRYLCCTLWTDFAIRGSVDGGMYEAGKIMNDYQYIRMESERYRRIHPIDVSRVHADHRAWLEARLSEPFEGRTIVVTHHALLGACLQDEKGVSSAYASDLSGLIDTYQPDRWLYGHTHHPCALQRGRTDLRNVSIGYPHEMGSVVLPALASLKG